MSGNRDQRAFWSDEAGPLWVAQRAALDIALASVLGGTLARAALEPGHSVLDIGCGAGASTLAAAHAVGATGHVTGIDISSTLLDAARAQASCLTNIAFLEADAQTHPFAPESADVILSRFGVMFFDDSVAAFKNIATALRANGRFVFSAWGAIADNPFFTLPAQVARQMLGPVPKSDPDGPGPFALRDGARISHILQDAGLRAHIETVQVPLTMPQGAAAMAEIMCHIGPANKALGHYGADDGQQRNLKEGLTQALAPFEHDSGITLPASINYVTACKPS